MYKSLRKLAFIIVFALGSIFLIGCDTKIDPSDWGLPNTTIDVTIGATHQINLGADEVGNDAFAYTSFNTSIISVSTTGLIEGLALGQTQITISYKEDPSLFSVTLTVNIVAAQPTSVVVTGDSNLQLGSSLTLSASVLPVTAPQTITYSSSDETVATVSSAGVVTPLKEGTVTIYAQSTSSTIVGSKQITITRPIATDVIIVGGTAVTLGSTLALSASVTPEFANQTITWTSSNETIATVSSTGVVTPLQVGSVVIKATSNVITVFDEVTITITAPLPISVVVSGPSVVVVGQTITLTANVLSSYADQSITWSSNNTSIATVSTLGVVSGVVVGSTTIRATASNGIYQDYTVTVSLPAATSVEVVGPSTIAVNQTATYTANVLPALSNQVVTWTSSSDLIATIDQDGVVTPVAEGTVIIKATAHSGVYKEITITITGPTATSVEIAGNSNLEMGSTLSLTSSVLPVEAQQTVTWSSSNTSIATVSASGVVTPRNAGVVVIRATSTQNPSVFEEITITITRPDATSVMVEGFNFVFIGSEAEFTAFVFPSLANQSVVWESSDEAVATVSNQGLVIGIAAGDVTITATAESGVFYAYELSVKPLMNEFYVDPSYAGRYGETISLGFDQYIYLGLNGFATISEAVNAIPADLDYATIEVAAGTYPQSLLINSSNISIVGPNYGVDPRNDVRGPEAIITGQIVLGYGTSDLEGITIGGFKFTGQAQIIQANNTAIDLFDFMYNVIEDINYVTTTNRGFIQFVASSTSKGVNNSYFAYNLFQNIYNIVTSNILVRPIWMEYASNVYITDNDFVRFERDVYLKDISQDVTITDNRFEQSKYRFIHINGFFGGFISVVNNTMETSLDAAVAIYGRLEYEPGMTIQVNHNHITDVNRGVYVDPEYSLNSNWVVNKPVIAEVKYNVIMVNHATNYWGQGSDVFAVDFTQNYWGSVVPTSAKFTNVPTDNWANYYTNVLDVPAAYTIDYQYPESITLTNQPSLVHIGNNYQLEVDFAPPSTNVFDVLWVSSNPNIATVSKDGVIEAYQVGQVTITGYAWFNRHVNISFTLNTNYAPGIAFSFPTMDNLFVVGDTFTLNSTPYPTIYSQETIQFVSSNEAVSTVANNGLVTMVGTGDVTITARFASNPNVSHSMSFYVSEVNNLNNLMDKLAAVQYASVEPYNFTVWGSTTYAHSTIKSVSMYYFGPNPVTQSIINKSPYTRTGRTMSALPAGITQYNPQNIHWIVVHDTGNSTAGSGALSHSNYLHNLTNNPNNTTYVSWHYTTDDNAIYQHIPNNERAFHAGDGSTLVGNHSTYLGGGNTNGIGIEMAIGNGYDIYRVWQKSAKLASRLAVEYNLPLANIKYHNDFSGKDCPQTLRKSGLISQFEIMKEIEYEVAKNHPTAIITFQSHNPRYLDDTGRVLELPILGTTVSYTITISENGNMVSRTFNTYLPGKTY